MCLAHRKFSNKASVSYLKLIFCLLGILWLNSQTGSSCPKKFYLFYVNNVKDPLEDAPLSHWYAPISFRMTI